MTFNIFRKAGGALVAALLAPGMILASTPPSCSPSTVTTATQSQNQSDEATQLLGDIRKDASEIRTHSDLIEMYTRDTLVGLDLHSTQLNLIKERVHDMGAKLCRLQAIREATQPWQQDAIDRAEKLVQSIAGNTASAIYFVNTNQSEFWKPQYRTLAGNLHQESEDLSQTIQGFQQLAHARQMQKQLERSLHTAGE